METTPVTLERGGLDMRSFLISLAIDGAPTLILRRVLMLARSSPLPFFLVPFAADTDR